jgi:hypothetical protein
MGDKGNFGSRSRKSGGRENENKREVIAIPN